MSNNFIEPILSSEQEWERVTSLCWSCARRNCKWLLYRGIGEEWLNFNPNQFKIWNKAIKFPIPAYEAPTQEDPYMYRIVECDHYIKGKVIRNGRPRTSKRRRK